MLRWSFLLSYNSPSYLAKIFAQPKRLMHWSIIFHFSAIKWFWLIKRLVHWRCSKSVDRESHF